MYLKLLPRLAGMPDWLGVNNRTLSTKLSFNLQKYFIRPKNIFNDQTIQNEKNSSKDQNQKNGEIKEILGRRDKKKSRLRAFARTRAKNVMGHNPLNIINTKQDPP